MELEGKIVLPELPELEFDDETHTYTVYGEIVPSVTQIMKPLSNAKYESIPQSVLDRAASRGTEIHSAIEFYLKYGVEEIDSQFRGYFDAFKSWWGTLDNPSMLGSEVKLYYNGDSEAQKELYGGTFAGTIDFIGFIGGVVTEIDFKSTSSIIDMTCGVQLEAYRQMLMSWGIVPERKLIVQLKADGKYSVREYPANDTRRWGVFRSLRIIDGYLKAGK